VSLTCWASCISPTYGLLRYLIGRCFVGWAAFFKPNKTRLNTCISLISELDVLGFFHQPNLRFTSLLDWAVLCRLGCLFKPNKTRLNICVSLILGLDVLGFLCQPKLRFIPTIFIWSGYRFAVFYNKLNKDKF